MQRNARFGTLLVILALISAGPAAAQNTSGAISGTITDTQGGVLPGVTLTVTNADTGVARTASPVSSRAGTISTRSCKVSRRSMSRASS